MNEEHEVKVAGVYKELPVNSNFHDLAFIGSWELYKQDLPEWLGWGNSWFRVLAQVKEGEDMAEVTALIKDMKKGMMSEDEGLRFNPELFLHPMTDCRLYSEFEMV